jgi:hypothetical protein
MRFLAEWYKPLMRAGLTYKVATLIKNDPFWTNAFFRRNSSIVSKETTVDIGRLSHNKELVTIALRQEETRILYSRPVEGQTCSNDREDCEVTIFSVVPVCLLQ